MHTVSTYPMNEENANLNVINKGFSLKKESFAFFFENLDFSLETKYPAGIIKREEGKYD